MTNAADHPTSPDSPARRVPRAVPQRGGLSRRLRRTSETYLMQAATRRVSARHGGRTPPRVSGTAWFWVRVYAPLYYRLPRRVRAAVIARLPGSHRQRWTYPDRPAGPAVEAYPADRTLTHDPAPPGSSPPTRTLEEEP